MKMPGTTPGKIFGKIPGKIPGIKAGIIPGKIPGMKTGIIPGNFRSKGRNKGSSSAFSFIFKTLKVQFEKSRAYIDQRLKG